MKNFQIFTLAALLIVVLFSVRTMVRNTDWSNGITLYSHDLKISDNFDIEDNLGVEYFEQGNYGNAINHFKKSYNMFPYEVNAYNIALAYVRMGDYKNAELYYDKSLKAKDYADTTHTHELGNYQLYAQLLLQLKNYKKAAVIIKRGLNDYPDVSQLWMLSAYTNYQTDDKQKALTDVQHAMKLDPNNTQVQALNESISQGKPITLNPVNKNERL